MYLAVGKNNDLKMNDLAMLDRLLFGISKRWIAGFAAKDAISAARLVNQLGMSLFLIIWYKL